VPLVQPAGGKPDEGAALDSARTDPTPVSQRVIPIASPNGSSDRPAPATALQAEERIPRAPSGEHEQPQQDYDAIGKRPHKHEQGRPANGFDPQRPEMRQRRPDRALREATEGRGEAEEGKGRREGKGEA
jgi:hypothetical protein